VRGNITDEVNDLGVFYRTETEFYRKYVIIARELKEKSKKTE